MSSTRGGSLGTGNVTLLSEMDQSRVPRAIEQLTQSCRTRTLYVSSLLPGGGALMATEPSKVAVGGATLFVLAVERTLQLGGDRAETRMDTSPADPARMKLIVAITPEDVSQRIVQALTEAQYRATLISTTGGFLRKGNATLLIGVESKRVDDVLARISAACPPAAPAGSQASHATIFVLDVQSYLRV